jgi:hypothetical protein
VNARQLGFATRKITLVVIVVVSSALLLGGGYQAIDATYDLLQHDALAAADATLDTFDCVQAKVDRRIPAGARVAIASPDPLWREPGLQGLYPRYDLTTKTHAEYVVTVTPRGAGCRLIDVDVAQVRQR